MLHGGRQPEVNGQRQGPEAFTLATSPIRSSPPGPLDVALLLRRFQRMLAPLVELILQSQALLVGFDGADRLHGTIDPRLRLELAELATPRHLRRHSDSGSARTT